VEAKQLDDGIADTLVSGGATIEFTLPFPSTLRTAQIPLSRRTPPSCTSRSLPSWPRSADVEVTSVAFTFKPGQATTGASWRDDFLINRRSGIGR